MKFTTVAVTLLAILIAANAHAATISPMLLPDGTWDIAISGELFIGDQAEFDRVLFATLKKGVVRTVHLNSPGGKVSEGYAFGREIQEEGLTTVVGSSSHCESACFLLLISGARKIVYQGAKIGVHSASVNGRLSTEGTQNVINYAIKLGNEQSLEVLHLLAATPPSTMSFLSVRQLKDLGIEVR